jgi:hypothetical protein
MHRWYPRPARLLPAGLVIGSVACALPAFADDQDVQWRIAVSPYTIHFRPSSEHQHVWAIGVERENARRWVLGAAYFRNSFGQPSGYVSIGQRYVGPGYLPELYFQWSAGLVYGYRGDYEFKVPLNNNGFSPGALISLGWVIDRQWSTQVNLLGDAGLMLQLNYTLP